jgi:hypothetical protein
MSVDQLPEDPSHWPSDSFELLGVKRGASEKELRRAYNQLIRRFKPELYPVQFRRIREAYEQSLLQARWYLPTEEPPASPSEAQPNSRTAERPTRPFEAFEPSAPAAPIRDAVDLAWDRVMAGERDSAYAALVQLSEQRPTEAAISLRLYWLLVLWPNLDTERNRHHWLARALAQSHLTYPANELYRRELEIAPEAALDVMYQGIFTAPSSLHQLAALLRWRFAASARLGWMNTLAEDLVRVKPRFMEGADEQWLELLVQANDWMVYRKFPHITAFITRELEGVQHLQLRLSYLFDRVDDVAMLSELTQAYIGYRFPPAVIVLLRSVWANHGSPTEAEVEAAAASLIHPKEITELLQLQPGQTLHALIQSVVRGFLSVDSDRRDEDNEEYSAEMMLALLREFGLDSRFGAYRLVRGEFLTLLTQLAIDPVELASKLQAHCDWHYAEELGSDVILRMLWLAGQLAPGPK